MYRTLLLLVSLFVFSLHAMSQETPAPPAASPPAPPPDAVFIKVEVEAEFPGGPDAWRKYLMQNLDASVPVKHKAPAGMYTVIVRFIVAKDGSLSDIVAETKHGYGMEEEVIRIMRKKQSPKWLPASQDGRAVNAYRRQPVTFVVSEK